MLPALDGFRVLETLRHEGMDTPVLVLTARGDEADKVRGLRNGADDYVTKPFALRELLARVGALLRRPRSSPGPLGFGAVVVDPATHARHPRRHAGAAPSQGVRAAPRPASAGGPGGHPRRAAARGVGLSGLRGEPDARHARGRAPAEAGRRSGATAAHSDRPEDGVSAGERAISDERAGDSGKSHPDRSARGVPVPAYRSSSLAA